MSAGEDNLRLLAAFARRLQNDPSFMAYTLARYQKQKGLDDEALADELGTLPEMVVRLALCRRPEAHSPDFAEQVRELSDFTLIDEAVLRCVIEQAEGLAHPAHHAIPRAGQSEPASTLSPFAGWLAAARAWAGVFARPSRPLTASLIVLMAAAAIGVLIWREYGKPSRSSLATHRPQPTAAPSEAASKDQPAAVTMPAASSSLPHSSPAQPAPIVRQKPPERLARAFIDLENYTPLRAVNEISRGEAIPLPPSRVQLRLRLPEPSVAGRYHVSIVDADEETLATDDAQSRDGKRLVVILDLSRLRKKGYRLSVMREGEASDYYPVVIGNAKAAPKE